VRQLAAALSWERCRPGGSLKEPARRRRSQAAGCRTPNDDPLSLNFLWDMMGPAFGCSITNIGVMKMRIVTAVLLLFLLAIPVIAAEIDGKWTATVDGMDGGKVELIYNFKADGTKLTGSVTGPLGEMKITEGKIEGNAVQFTVGDEQFSMSSKGTLSGDEIKLTTEMMGNPSTSVLKRVK